MDFIAKAFVFINEFLLFVFLIAPIPSGFFYFANTPISTATALTFGGLSLLYYVFVVALFGWLALAIENNRALKRIAELLEQQQSDRRRITPKMSGASTEVKVQRAEPILSVKDPNPK